MNNEITYFRVASGLAVYIGNRRIGTTVSCQSEGYRSEGYQYRAGPQRGKIFKTIDEVKQSLEKMTENV